MDLHGSCACGRNIFVVEIPATSTQQAQVFFDNSSSSRRHLSSPLTAWLHIPYSWFHSTTFAFFPDETHRAIRRTFVSPFDATTRRNFCGYCGTQLSKWQESANSRDEFIQLTLSSIFEEDLERLEEVGMLRLEDEQGQDRMEVTRRFEPARGVRHRGAPWFESLVKDGPLGKVKRQKGGFTSVDGTQEVEWEIEEWTGIGEEDSSTAAKRKIGEVEEQEDSEMRS